nr:hypothetical protein CKG001_10290 [Bdellovibrio sp. CKG001]
MTAVEPGRKILHKEALRYRGAVSQALLYTLAAICNFLALRHIERKQFNINSVYGAGVIGAFPLLAIDGYEPLEFDSEIVNIWVFNRNGGTGGTTEFDIKWKAHGSAVWESIFSGVGGVTPKITSAAASHQGCGIGDTVPGFTAPVPVKTTFNAKDCLRVDLLSAMTGNPNGAYVVVTYRPR